MRYACSDAYCPLCYENVRGRCNHRGHRGYRSPPSPMLADVRAFMKRPSKPGAGVPLEHARVDDPVAQRCPLLWEHMSAEQYDDGTARVTSTLFLFLEGCRWKCMFKDRQEGKIAFYTAHSLAELLDTIESHLRTDSVDWKHDRKPAGRGR